MWMWEVLHLFKKAEFRIFNYQRLFFITLLLYVVVYYGWNEGDFWGQSEKQLLMLTSSDRDTKRFPKNCTLPVHCQADYLQMEVIKTTIIFLRKIDQWRSHQEQRHVILWEVSKKLILISKELKACFALVTIRLMMPPSEEHWTTKV